MAGQHSQFDRLLQSACALQHRQQLISMGTSSPDKTHDQAIFLTFFFGGPALAALGLSDMIPFEIDLVLYVVGFIFMLYGVFWWKTAKHWNGKRKLAFLLLITAAYWLIFGLAAWNQYQRELSAKLQFKESPLFSWWFKQRTIHDISRFRSYLRDLGISTPARTPPLGVEIGSGACNALTPPNLPLYRSEITIGEKSVTSRQEVVGCYAIYAIDQIMSKALAHIPWPIPKDRMAEIGENGMLSITFSDYFVASYWGKKPNAPNFGLRFWDFRESLGPEFTDRLIAAALGGASDTPSEGQDSNLDLYCAAKLKIAESVIDGECARWPQIEAILLKQGVDSDKLQKQDFSQSGVSNACVKAWSK
jgi:hypothetical protein